MTFVEARIRAQTWADRTGLEHTAFSVKSGEWFVRKAGVKAFSTERSTHLCKPSSEFRDARKKYCTRCAAGFRLDELPIARSTTGCQHLEVK